MLVGFSYNELIQIDRILIDIAIMMCLFAEARNSEFEGRS